MIRKAINLRGGSSIIPLACHEHGTLTRCIGGNSSHRPGTDDRVRWVGPRWREMPLPPRIYGVRKHGHVRETSLPRFSRTRTNRLRAQSCQVSGRETREACSSGTLRPARRRNRRRRIRRAGCHRRTGHQLEATIPLITQGKTGAVGISALMFKEAGLISWLLLPQKGQRKSVRGIPKLPVETTRIIETVGNGR